MSSRRIRNWIGGIAIQSSGLSSRCAESSETSPVQQGSHRKIEQWAEGFGGERVNFRISNGQI